jgi:hypothetical protein
MERVRIAVGFVCAGFLVLSFGAHSLLGWKAVSEQLAATNAPAELVEGLGIAWRLGGAAMLGFAAIAARGFVLRRRGARGAMGPVAIVAATYFVYGLWAFVTSGFDPFFAVLFVLPGAALGFASMETRAG